ncbi:MAG: hypothetical protein KKE57_06430, partial [Proteobacteria bacterium]|nr:hypothetical protein [Pseudomonadota bacterium]
MKKEASRKEGNESRRKDSAKKRPKRSKTDKGPGVGVEVTLSDESYRAFIEDIDDGVYEVDLRGNFT